MTFQLSPVGKVKRNRIREHDKQVNWRTQGSEAGRRLDHSKKCKNVILLLEPSREENPERNGGELSWGQIMLQYSQVMNLEFS